MSLLNKLFGKNKTLYLNCIDKDIAKVAYKEIAIQIAINLIAKAISNSEFLTYKKYSKVKKDNYYLFNIEPNLNQNATEFWNEFVDHLIYDGEVVVFQNTSNEFIVADDFDKQIVNNQIVFYNITKDDYSYNFTKKISEVIYLKFNNKKIKNYIDALYQEYSSLLSKLISDFKRQNALKLKVKISTLLSQRYDDQTQLQDYIKQKINPIFQDANAAIPIEDGFDVSVLDSNSSKNISIDDVSKGIDNAFKYVSMALHIPESIMKGNLADVKEQTKNFFTWCVDPIAKQIDREFNRKYFGKNAVLSGSYLRCDTSRVEHYNIFDIATSLETLIKIGYSPNEVRSKVDDEELLEDWANEHYLLENYKPLRKGGDENEQKNEEVL